MDRLIGTIFSYRVKLFHRQFLIATTLIIIILLPSITVADNYLTETKKEIVLQAQTHLLNDDFENAHQLLDSLIRIYPDDPIGYLFKAAVYLGEMTDAEENLYQLQFNQLIDMVIFLAERKVDTKNITHSNPDTVQLAWMHLLMGHAQAYKSLWESRFGSFTSALKFGFNARSDYEKGLEYDSSLYDLYGGLGLYHYWKSAKAGILRRLRLFKNDKQKGIDELYLTLDSSYISQHTSRNALIWIWLDKKEYDSVITICREMIQSFPRGKIFLWPMAKAYYEMEDFKKALEAYLLLRERLQKSSGSYYNLIECDYYLCRCYEKMKLKNDMKQAAEKLYKYYRYIPKKIRWRQRSKIAFLKHKARR